MKNHYVGVFYYVDGIVYSHKWKVDEAYLDWNGVIGAPASYSHSNLFMELYDYPELRIKYPEVFAVGLGKYRNYFLRGRVVFCTYDERYHILTNEYIAKEENILAAIRKEFGIEEEKYEVDCMSIYEIYNKDFAKR